MRDAKVRKKRIRETRKQIEKAKRYLFTNGVQNDDIALTIEGLQDKLYYDYWGKKQYRKSADIEEMSFFRNNYAVTVILTDNRYNADNYEYDLYFESLDEAIEAINDEKNSFISPDTIWEPDKKGNDLLNVIGTKKYVKEQRTYKKVLNLSLRSLTDVKFNDILYADWALWLF